MTDYHAGKKWDIGLEEALSITLHSLSRLPAATLPVAEVSGLAAAEDLFAAVDCPSAASSLRDGYAILSRDTKGVSEASPARLRIAGASSAGDLNNKTLEPGLALKVLTGARLPAGADAVAAVEHTREEDGYLLCSREVSEGWNVLSQGADAASGERVALRGEILTPGLTGLLAAAGIDRVPAIPLPRVAVLATGDEVVAPGHVIQPGQLYASNLITLYSWLRSFRMEAKTDVVKDRSTAIQEAVAGMLSWADVILTSGGAWKSERDLTVRVIEEMGCTFLFHRVRMGPGKAVAFGMMGQKAVFCLPGGPPSNEMAFLQIALPGLLHMGGRPPVPFQTRWVRLAEAVAGDIAWTQFIHARMERRDGEWWAVPQRMKSRLQSQARAEALIRIPEGASTLASGEAVDVQMLRSLCE